MTSRIHLARPLSTGVRQLAGKLWWAQLDPCNRAHVLDVAQLDPEGWGARWDAFTESEQARIQDARDKVRAAML